MGNVHRGTRVRITHMLGVFLAIHFTGAFFMAASALVALIVLRRGTPVSLRRSSYMLSVFFVLQSLTGVALGLLSPEASLLRFCASFILYLALFSVLQFMLIVRQTPDRVAPWPAVIAGSLGSMMFLATLPVLF